MTGVSPHERHRRHDMVLAVVATLAALWIGVRAPVVSPVAPPPPPTAPVTVAGGNG